MFDERDYVLVFVARNGMPPYECYFCKKPVESLRGRKGHVHHVDEDHSNMSEENLVAAHSDCHLRHHRLGKKFPNRKRSGPPSEEHRRAVGDGVRGHEQTSEARANSSTAARRRYQDPVKREASAASMRGIPKSSTHKLKISEKQRSMTETCDDCGESYRPCHRRYHDRKCPGRQET